VWLQEWCVASLVEQHLLRTLQLTAGVLKRLRISAAVEFEFG
jgi:hypothetical protein